MENNLTKTYITESLCCTPETHNIVNQLYFNLKKCKKKKLTRSKYQSSSII